MNSETPAPTFEALQRQLEEYRTQVDRDFEAHKQWKQQQVDKPTIQSQLAKLESQVKLNRVIAILAIASNIILMLLLAG